MQNTLSRESQILDFVNKHLSEKVDDSIKSWNDFPPWQDIPNMSTAIKRFKEALEKNEGIYFVHDSDADGVGSAVVFANFMKSLNYENTTHRITHRADGYGFIPLHVDEALQKKASLIITSDNGITSKEATDYAASKGMDVIITDHHQPIQSEYPEKAIVVDPQMIRGPHKLKDISGTVVVWYFIKAFNDLSMVKTKLSTYYEELALTTVTDIMPLKHVNRFMVKEGLKYFNSKRKPYTKIAIEHNKYDSVFTSESIGFSLGPLINVANRFQFPEAAFSFLSANTDNDARQWYQYLEKLNEHRKQLTQYYTDIIKQAPHHFGNFVYCNLNEQIEKGILGILANKFAQEYNCPAVITKTLNDDTVAGSGRSAGKIDMLSIMNNIDNIKAGGHKQAFGVSFDKKHISAFVNKCVTGISNLPSDVFEDDDKAIMDLPFRYISQDLYDMIYRFEPYGKGFERPVFGANALVYRADKFGKEKNHSKLTLMDEDKNFATMVAFFETRNFTHGQRIRINYSIRLSSMTGAPEGRIEKILI